MTAAIGQKRNLFVAGPSRRCEDLPGLSGHTNAVAHVVGWHTIDRELPNVGLQLHAADRYCAALGDVWTHVRRLTRCDPPDDSITQCHLPQAQRWQIRHGVTTA